MSTERCVDFCQSAGYTMAGTEDGKVCFCGSELVKENGGGSPTDSGQCSTRCAGEAFFLFLFDIVITENDRLPFFWKIHR
jgi:hypothetical protein